jgi:phospholipase/carboxylesterase
MQKTLTAGVSLEKAEKVLIMVHGRGGTAADILALANELNTRTFALIAPQAEGNSWYPHSFLAPRSENEPFLSNSLKRLLEIVIDLEQKGFDRSQIYLLGFSQGACLTLEFTAAHASRYGGIVAFTGGVIGERIDHRNYTGDLDGTPIFIGSSDPDFHVPVDRVKDTTKLLSEMGASVTEVIYEKMGHTISPAEITQVNKLIFND